MNRRDFAKLASLGAVAGGFGCLSASGAPQPEAAGPRDREAKLMENGKPTYLDLDGSAWRLAMLRGERGKRTLGLVCGYDDGRVVLIDPQTGARRWEIPGEDFPFWLETADIDGCGTDEALTATAGGALRASGADGATRWMFQAPSGYPLYVATCGQPRAGQEPLIACGGIERRLWVLDGSGRVVAEREAEFFVHRAAWGDFDGDGGQELALMDGRELLRILKIDGQRIEEISSGKIQLPNELINWENPSGAYKPFDLIAADVDGDGRDELIFGDSFNNRQTVAVVDVASGMRWISTPLEWWAKDRTWYEFFSTAFVDTVAAQAGDGRRDILTVCGGLVRRFRFDGKLLGEAESELGFADLLVDGDALYLGSTPNGDRTVYRIDLSADWQAAVQSLQPRGLAAEIRRNLADLRERAKAAPLDDAAIGQNYVLQQFSLSASRINRESYEAMTRSFAKQVAPQAFCHTISLRALEDKPVLKEDGEPWNLGRFKTDELRGTNTPDEIVAMAERIERERIPTAFAIGHNSNPFVTLETAERMLQAAPNYLVGFQTAEDVSESAIGPYLEHFIGPLCDLCLRHGRTQVVIKNKVLWWLDAPARDDIYRNLFGTERAKVVVAATEESNARWSDINLMARMSLRYAGLVGAMKVHVHRDMFCYNRFHQWEYPKSGHPFLRMLVAHTVCGASLFSISLSDAISHEQRPSGQLVYNQLGRESTETFLELVGRGVVFPPSPEQMANLNPVGIVMHSPPEKWMRNAHNNHRPWEAAEDEETLHAVLPRLHCGWGNAPVPEFALPRVLFGKRRVFDGEVPATPYGHVLMLPSHFDRSALTGVKRWWHTDGIYLWEDGGKRLTGKEAGRALQASFEEGKRRLRFRVDGDPVFCQVLALGGGTFRIVLADAGWLVPEDRRVRMAHRDGAVKRVKDVIGHAAVDTDGGGFDVRVPAGSIRILDCEV